MAQDNVQSCPPQPSEISNPGSNKGGLNQGQILVKQTYWDYDDFMNPNIPNPPKKCYYKVMSREEFNKRREICKDLELKRPCILKRMGDNCNDFQKRVAFGKAAACLEESSGLEDDDDDCSSVCDNGVPGPPNFPGQPASPNCTTGHQMPPQSSHVPQSQPSNTSWGKMCNPMPYSTPQTHEGQQRRCNVSRRPPSAQSSQEQPRTDARARSLSPPSCKSPPGYPARERERGNTCVSSLDTAQKPDFPQTQTGGGVDSFISPPNNNNITSMLSQRCNNTGQQNFLPNREGDYGQQSRFNPCSVSPPKFSYDSPNVQLPRGFSYQSPSVPQGACGSSNPTRFTSGSKPCTSSNISMESNNLNPINSQGYPLKCEVTQSHSNVNLKTDTGKCQSKPTDKKTSYLRVPDNIQIAGKTDGMAPKNVQIPKVPSKNQSCDKQSSQFQTCTPSPNILSHMLPPQPPSPLYPLAQSSPCPPPLPNLSNCPSSPPSQNYPNRPNPCNKPPQKSLECGGSSPPRDEPSESSSCSSSTSSGCSFSCNERPPSDSCCEAEPFWSPQVSQPRSEEHGGGQLSNFGHTSQPPHGKLRCRGQIYTSEDECPFENQSQAFTGYPSGDDDCGCASDESDVYCQNQNTFFNHQEVESFECPSISGEDTDYCRENEGRSFEIAKDNRFGCRKEIQQNPNNLAAGIPECSDKVQIIIQIPQQFSNSPTFHQQPPLKQLPKASDQAPCQPTVQPTQSPMQLCLPTTQPPNQPPMQPSQPPKQLCQSSTIRQEKSSCQPIHHAQMQSCQPLHSPPFQPQQPTKKACQSSHLTTKSSGKSHGSSPKLSCQPFQQVPKQPCQPPSQQPCQPHQPVKQPCQTSYQLPSHPCQPSGHHQPQMQFCQPPNLSRPPSQCFDPCQTLHSSQPSNEPFKSSSQTCQPCRPPQQSLQHCQSSTQNIKSKPCSVYPPMNNMHYSLPPMEPVQTPPSCAFQQGRPSFQPCQGTLCKCSPSCQQQFHHQPGQSKSISQNTPISSCDQGINNTTVESCIRPTPRVISDVVPIPTTMTEPRNSNCCSNNTRNQVDKKSCGCTSDSLGFPSSPDYEHANCGDTHQLNPYYSHSDNQIRMQLTPNYFSENISNQNKCQC